jgi:hypothetical protein
MKTMSNLPWNTALSTPHDLGASETEALQTDIMRFLAILGLCLMAIFALVQSIPLVPQDQASELGREQLLVSRVEELRRTVARLSAESNRLDADIGEARIARRSAEQAATVAQTQAQKAATENRQLQAEAEQARQALHAARQALKAQHQRLTELRSNESQKLQSLKELDRRLAEDRSEEARLRARLQAIREQIVKSASVAPAPLAEPATETPQGFSLRFASEEALSELVRKGSVAFYAAAGSRFWRLSINGSDRVFNPTSGPNEIHEMTPGTVPEPLRGAFRRTEPAIDPKHITWGVTLSADTVAEIQSLMTGGDGGVLDIHPDGHVVLRSESE